MEGKGGGSVGGGGGLAQLWQQTLPQLDQGPRVRHALQHRAHDLTVGACVDATKGVPM